MEKPELLDMPSKPKTPPFYSLPLSKIPSEELENAIQGTKEYMKLLDGYKERQKIVIAENARREAEYQEGCWKEIYDENGIEHSEQSHELVSWARSKAWEDGHAYGMSEVSSCFSDLIEAYKIHRKLMDNRNNQK